MNRDQQERALEPLELGVASVETRGAGWPIPEAEGYMFILGMSDQ